MVVQNSLREGFGLPATEAMWKAVPVLGTSAYASKSATAWMVGSCPIPKTPTQSPPASTRCCEVSRLVY